jgi:hypothetical protein
VSQDSDAIPDLIPNDDEETAETVLPWWPVATQGTLPVPYYHASTQLPGKLSMIVDIGAWTNLIGSDMARALTQRALANGLKPGQNKMTSPLTIQGVGNGSQQCVWQISCPIAVPYGDGKARMHKITSPIVEGTGAKLPGLLGLRSLEHERSIIDTGKRMLYFLGPGEAQIILPPGSSAIPLQKAPSGHLVMEIDAYENVQAYKGGLPDVSLQLHATEAEKAEPEVRLEPSRPDEGNASRASSSNEQSQIPHPLSGHWALKKCGGKDFDGSTLEPIEQDSSSPL